MLKKKKILCALLSVIVPYRVENAVFGVLFGTLQNRVHSFEDELIRREIGDGFNAAFNGANAKAPGCADADLRQGMFGDPYYGGNANFVGWDLLGYPGIRTMVTADDQKAYESGTLAANHKSAYDSEMFAKP